jgi:hypothetical protein
MNKLFIFTVTEIKYVRSSVYHRLNINAIFHFNACKDIVIFIYETLLLFNNFPYIGICIINLAITVKGLKREVEPKMPLSAHLQCTTRLLLQNSSC